MRGANDILLPTTVRQSPRRAKARKRLTIVAWTGLVLVICAGLYSLIGHERIRRPESQLRRTSLRTGSDEPPGTEPLVEEAEPVAQAPGNTLVIYVFANTDPEYEANLRHFVREGIHEHDGCAYVIAIQEGPELPVIQELPALPPNAKYVHHKNECFDSGTVGWVLDSQIKHLSAYKYIVWLNGSQRGPYLPAYAKRRMHWTEALTDRLSSKVKMVGATIHCGAPFDVPSVPHVQSYLVAVDQKGLEIVRKDSKALRCWSTMKDTIIHSELGASAAIFLAGYSIDCLMLRYQGVNWRSMDALDCNAGLTPLPEAFNDGINIDPLEVMFVKVKTGLKTANWSYVQQAMKYDQWSQHARGLTAADLRANSWATAVRPAILETAYAKGSDCFDDGFYVSSGPVELQFILEAPDRKAAAFDHFINGGLSEGRPYKFLC